MRPLHYGAWQGHDGLVELLLLHGSDVNEPASDGNTPLHLASEHGHFCVVSLISFSCFAFLFFDVSAISVGMAFFGSCVFDGTTELKLA